MSHSFIQSYLVHLFLDLGVLSAAALTVASAAAAATDVLVAVLVHLVVDIVALVVSARLILSFARRNEKLSHFCKRDNWKLYRAREFQN